MNQITIAPCTQYRFTAREQEVAELLAAGLRQTEIAARLVISARTVQYHEGKIMEKLGVNNRFAAALQLHLRGIARQSLPVLPPT